MRSSSRVTDSLCQLIFHSCSVCSKRGKENKQRWRDNIHTLVGISCYANWRGTYRDATLRFQRLKYRNIEWMILFIVILLLKVDLLGQFQFNNRLLLLCLLRLNGILRGWMNWYNLWISIEWQSRSSHSTDQFSSEYQNAFTGDESISTTHKGGIWLYYVCDIIDLIVVSRWIDPFIEC